jgi:glucosyl-dolichyl phosphate glucuronosyltransferase
MSGKGLCNGKPLTLAVNGSPCSLTVVICTFNRQKFVEKLLMSLKRCSRFPSVKALVVDNNSTDTTAQFVMDFNKANPNTSYLLETQQGLSFARNAALRRTDTTHVLFLDDDCTVSEDYLDRAMNIIELYNPDFFGGPIFLDWSGSEPAWLRQIETPKIHQSPTGFHENGRLSGGNFGMRTALVNSIGFFNTDLGMKGGGVGVYEEKAYLDLYGSKVHPKARRIYYDVDMPILHRVLPHKFSKLYHLQREFLNGVAEVRSASRHSAKFNRKHISSKAMRIMWEQIGGAKDGRRIYWMLRWTKIVHQIGRLIGVIITKLSAGPAEEMGRQ